MKKHFRVSIILLLFAISLSAQTTDLARVEYLHIPFAKSDNSVNRFRALAQIPIPLYSESKQFLVVGLEYRHVDINIEDPVPFDPNIISNIQQIDAYLGYTFKMKNDWRIGFKAGVKLQSNFTDNIVNDDIIYEGAVYFINDKKGDSIPRPSRLIFGLIYSTTPGRNYPLPLFNYYREFHPNWTYTIGVPKSNIRHYLNNNHKDALQAFVTLDNFFGNIQQNISLPNNPILAENVSMTMAITGIGYEHFFTEHLLFYSYAAHSVYNEFRLRDHNRETAYIINDENTFYIRGGLKFKF